nr:MAG TPA: hypothetical protein [Caudoviricetes sp.]DAU80290.1 MAG TPA: hypothetical protein [Inoviridae sp.]
MIRPLRLSSDYIAPDINGILKQKYPNGEALLFDFILAAFNGVIARFEIILRIISHLKEKALKTGV